MYTVFTSKKKIFFSYWGAEVMDFKTAREVFSCKKNGFAPEDKSIEEIHRMIAEGFVFFPIDEGTKAGEIKNYIEMGFNVAFLRAGDFKRLKKDYRDFI